MLKYISKEDRHSLFFLLLFVFTHCVFLRGAGANATVMTMELRKILLIETGPAFLDCLKIAPY